MSDTEKLQRQNIIATAIYEVMLEIMGEQRDQIMTRAKAKLVAQGVPVEQDELGAHIG